MRDLKNAINEEAGKLIRRFENYARQLADEYERRCRRTTTSVKKLVLKRPHYWSLADGFDPFLVRARANCIAHSVHRKFSDRTYAPLPPVQHFVPKAGGGRREVCVFQVTDSAVSRVVYEGLMEKNRPRMSSRAYAYRDDITAQDALQYVAAEVREQSRVFVAEYDFSKYFDNISHDYLLKILKDRQFLLTRAEKSVIDAFLRVLPVPAQGYQSNPGPRRERGIPQGTSISLFLANVAAWDLDRSLERLGVSFVRYADDTLIWSTDYAQLCRAVDTLHEIAARIGSPINLEKSGGIRLLVPDGAPAEMPSVRSIEYLGHEITLSSVGMKEKVIKRIKERVNELLYFNLIREPESGFQNMNRLQRVDRDYVTFIWQLRRYLYGDISERRLRRFQQGGVPRRRFRGVMSFFPLLDDQQQLKELDAWLVCSTCMALRKRGRLLNNLGLTNLPDPHGLLCQDLAGYIRTSKTTGGQLDLRLPSFRRIASVIRQAATSYGTNSIARTARYDY
jgi:RNA-directed DNA polymerase